MKWISLLIAFGLFVPIIFYGDTFNMKKKLLYPDNHIASLNALLKEEFINRAPKSRDLQIREFPTLTPWHRMTRSIECYLISPSIKTKNPQEAINVSLPYAQAYVDTINNVPLIRPYLIDFPMSLQMWNFCIGLGENEKTRLPLYFPYIASVLFNGYEFRVSCFYETITYPNGRTCHNSYDNIYDNSKGIPDEIKQMAVPRFDTVENKVPQLIPQSKKYFYLNQGMEHVYDFYKEVAQRNNLVFIAFEDVFDLDRPYDRKICAEVAYASQEKKLSLQEAKELAQKLRDEQALFYLPKPSFVCRVNGMRKDGREEQTNPINIQKYLSFRISFWDEYIDRVHAPAIAEVRVYGTRARYYVADELQRLQVVCEEEFPPFERDIPLPETPAKE